MAKYHLKEDGAPAKCSAELRACPRGGAESHYPSAAAARTAFEASMGSALAPVAKKQPSFMDRLRGKMVPPEPTAAEELKKVLKTIKDRYILSDRSSVYKLAESASHYEVLEQESLAVVQHGVAVEDKFRALHTAVETIVSENHRAFDYEASKYKWRMLETRDWRGDPMTAPILKAGGNEALHRSLTPMLNDLIAQHARLTEERERVEEEAATLHAQVMREGELNPQQRQVLSEEAQRLYDAALADTPAIPSPEQVQDRQAWTQARIEAVEELRDRNVL